MASFTHGKGAKVYVADSGATLRDVSAAATSVSLPISADTAETSALGDSAKTYLGGLKDATFSIELNRDATIEGYLFGVVAATTTYQYFPEGSATGKVQYSGTIIGTSLEPSSSVDDANKLTFEAQHSGAVTRTVLS